MQFLAWLALAIYIRAQNMYLEKIDKFSTRNKKFYYDNSLIYTHLRGFDFKKVNGQNVEREVTEWSGDGIHMDSDNHPEFMSKY